MLNTSGALRHRVALALRRPETRPSKQAQPSNRLKYSGEEIECEPLFTSEQGDGFHAGFLLEWAVLWSIDSLLAISELLRGSLV